MFPREVLPCRADLLWTEHPIGTVLQSLIRKIRRNANNIHFERFPFVSQDGPNLKKNGDMAHLQKFTQIQAMESVSKFSYIKVVPTNPIEPPPTGSPLVEVFEKFFPTGPDGNVVSGTNVRKAFKGISEELLPDLFTYLFGGYNDKIFNIVKRRLR